MLFEWQLIIITTKVHNRNTALIAARNHVGGRGVGVTIETGSQGALERSPIELFRVRV